MGTWNVSALNTLPVALDFHLGIGAPSKQARFRYLRDRWAVEARALGVFDVLTPDEPGAYGAMTSFRMKGHTSPEANVAIARWLMDRYRIFTVSRDGLPAGSCVRMTPALYNTVDDVDLLVEALRKLARQGAPI